MKSIYYTLYFILLITGPNSLASSVSQIDQLITRAKEVANDKEAIKKHKNVIKYLLSYQHDQYKKSQLELDEMTKEFEEAIKQKELNRKVLKNKNETRSLERERVNDRIGGLQTSFPLYPSKIEREISRQKENKKYLDQQILELESRLKIKSKKTESLRLSFIKDNNNYNSSNELKNIDKQDALNSYTVMDELLSLENKTQKSKNKGEYLEIAQNLNNSNYAKYMSKQKKVDIITKDIDFCRKKITESKKKIQELKNKIKNIELDIRDSKAIIDRITSKQKGKQKIEIENIKDHISELKLEIEKYTKAIPEIEKKREKSMKEADEARLLFISQKDYLIISRDCGQYIIEKSIKCQFEKGNELIFKYDNNTNYSPIERPILKINVITSKKLFKTQECKFQNKQEIKCNEGLYRTTFTKIKPKIHINNSNIYNLKDKTIKYNNESEKESAVEH
jgi:hypothetical protein